MFDQHYENPDEPVTCNKFLNSCIYRLQAQSNLFGLPTAQAVKVSTNAWEIELPSLGIHSYTPKLLIPDSHFSCILI